MVKDKSWGLTVLLLLVFVLVLFIAQVFVPFEVIHAQSEGNETVLDGNGNLTFFTNVSENTSVKTTDEEPDKNRITFVLGTDENLASLLNASINTTVNATVNITIYNATEAKSINFSNENVLFLASLDNETVASINSMINESAYVFVYNLTTNISIGNVDDVNITRYWVYGSDENIRNLILYMDNKFYGNNTAFTPPEPPAGRAKVAFVVSEMSSYAAWLENTLDDVYITRNLNVSLCTYMHDNPESYQGMNLSDQDVILLWMIGYPVQDAIHKTVLDAKNNNSADVITIAFTDIYGMSSVNLTSPEYEDIATYWANGGTENMRRLLVFLGVKLCDIPIGDFGIAEIPVPVEIPQFGIYHPDAKAEGKGIQGLGIFSSVDDYLAWYKSTGRFNESAPTVGIHYYYVSGKYGSYATLDPLIKIIEDKGANVIFATFSYKDSNTTTYFLKDGKPLVDSLIILNSFRLWHHHEDEGIGYLQQLNVTPIKGIMSYYMDESVWNESNGLSPSEIAWQVALPELDGETEFILFSGKEKDPVSGEYYYRPFDSQLEWITDRALSIAKLHRKENSDKKVAIVYYNHGGGKDNLGASYLDIVPSLTSLLDAMKKEGYDVEGEVPDEKELLDLMLHEGRNIGTWAPDELEKMVENESVILIPTEEYKSWFNELPANKREEVIDKWGEPPGEIMVYENGTGKYLVIPGVRLGNVLLAPQPTRGWLQNQSVLYHDKELPPHHQYIAFYLWLKKAYGVDAIIHFGTHGTQEWLPGKETALSARDCWPAILIQDIPVVYPYIMDNVGEGTQAKRRGNAVIVDHLTPPIVAGGLYGNLSLLHERIHRYLATTENSTLKAEYRETITGLYENLNLSEDLGISADDLRVMNETAFEDFINGPLHEYLHDLASEFMPYGLHILGSPPDDWKLVSMVESMLGSEFEEHIAEVYPDPHELSPAHENCTVIEELLSEVLLNGTDPEEAQKKVLGAGNVSINVTADLETARVYAANLKNCTIEIPRILDALDGGYIPPKVGNDPIRNPEALPTGNNFHSFDPREIPTKEAWEVGKAMADNLLEQYRVEHNGLYPERVAFVLFCVETMRHQGIMESEILYLMGVKPKWDKRGRVKGVELIPCSELQRPRIDVLITTSGLYRDTFAGKIEIIDQGVRVAARKDDNNCTNYVKEHTDAIHEWLIENGYSEDNATCLSMARVFSEESGNYGTGLPDAIAASNTWNDTAKLANLYINRLGYAFGDCGWSLVNPDLFRENLRGVDVAIHSRSSNLYGVLDNDDQFSYLGGLALAVRTLTGQTPDLYITNLRDPHNPMTETLQSFLRRELVARYFNPKWIEGMMEHDYAGAREMMKFTEYLWGWDVVTPDIITADMWNQVYDVYVRDKYNLGLKDFFDSNNPYAEQSITARMLEAIRKGYWTPSEDIKTVLAETYQESVEKYGVTCCHHTCGNPLFQEYIPGILSVPEQPPEQQRYYRVSDGGGGARLAEAETKEETGEGLTNMTETKGVSKTGEELKKPLEEASEKKGKVMKEEKPIEKPSPVFPISGAPLMGIIAVIVVLVLIGIGLGLKRRKR